MTRAQTWRSLEPAMRSALQRLHDALALVGIAAIAWAAVHLLSVLLMPAANQQEGGPETASVLMPSSRASDPRRAALADYLSRRFRVARDATEEVIAAAYDAGRQLGLDPLVILSVIAVESGFNPIAESGVGAQGLMQVIPKHHARLLHEIAGERTVLDPVTNIRIGARILKGYVALTGSLEDALQFYNGAAADMSYEYAQKVIAERARLQDALGQRRALRDAT